MYVAAIIITVAVLLGFCVPVNNFVKYGKENGLYED